MSNPFKIFADKNPTPTELARTSAALLAAALLGILCLYKLLFQASFDWLAVVLIPLLAFFIGYWVYHQSLKYFIYRKIKVIYKVIHSYKSNKEAAPIQIDMNTHMIDRVQQEVRDWATDWTAEMEAMRNMEQYKREYIGNVSHELKTPIFNIQGYLHTLLDGGLYDEKINLKYLTRAVDNAERMADLVEDLGLISKSEAGMLYLEKEGFDIRQLMGEVLRDMELLASKKNIRLEFKDEKPEPIWVYADIKSIRRVAINLVSNSVKYGKEGGKTLVGFYDMEDHILIELTDDGKGIGQEHLPRLFERFYRVDKGRARSEGGTGLGLAIVKHILESHGQQIHVRSTVGVGSTFGFTLEKKHQSGNK